MPGFNSALAPDVIQTRLDVLFDGFLSQAIQPDFAEVTDAGLFRQISHDRGIFNSAIQQPVGMWTPRSSDTAALPIATIREGFLRASSILDFAQELPLSKDLFDDDGNTYAVEKAVSSFARAARLARRQAGVAVYRNGFTTSTTNQGSPLFSNTHTTLAGTTVDNLLSGAASALSDVSLNDGVVSISQQQDQGGNIVAHSLIGGTLLVPCALYKTACEVVYSELRSGTADNDLNIFGKYGLRVKQSEYLGSNNAGGSDTAWFLIANDHSVNRVIRQDIETYLVDFKFSESLQYIYRGLFREVYFADSYEGLVGATGV